MAFRDRFFTPATAKAILSWRILLGAAVGVAVALAGMPVLGAIGVGLVVYAASVAAAMPKAPKRPVIDPFTVGEPWRQFVQTAQRSRRQLRDTLAGAPEGPLRDRLQDIADRLDRGLLEGWQIAKRGNEIDGIVRRLDPTRLRSRLATLQTQASNQPTENLPAAISSVESQLASAERLKALSADTADHLRLAQARLDELVSRAAEVSVGASDTGHFAHEVDELVLELEAMHQAVQELPR
ncbi:MAG TPA: hypothetical protein VK360_03080 [Acidimicrobiales bacterium]|nr:hypothetical protein [Acidimicrobiales bacterium]